MTQTQKDFRKFEKWVNSLKDQKLTEGLKKKIVQKAYLLTDM